MHLFQEENQIVRRGLYGLAVFIVSDVEFLCEHFRIGVGGQSHHISGTTLPVGLDVVYVRRINQRPINIVEKLRVNNLVSAYKKILL